MLFSPHLFVVDATGRPSPLAKPAAAGQRICIIPREACTFRRIRLAGEGRNAIKAALLKVRKDALPGEDGIQIIPDKASGNTANRNTANSMAGVWNFSKSAVHKGRYLPETLAREAYGDGIRLVTCLTGLEGQIWKDGILLSSRWWPGEPSASQWEQFVRAAEDQHDLSGMTLGQPAPMLVPWRRDLPAFNMDRDRVLELASPVNLGAILAAGFAFAFAYLGSQYVRETISLRQAERAQQAVSVDAQQILSQRRRALAAIRASGRYESLGSETAVLEGIGAVAKVLGATDLAIARAGLRNAVIEITLEGTTEISVPDVVSLLEAEAALSGVSVSIDQRSNIRINATLTGLKAL